MWLELVRLSLSLVVEDAFSTKQAKLKPAESETFSKGVVKLVYYRGDKAGQANKTKPPRPISS